MRKQGGTKGEKEKERKGETKGQSERKKKERALRGRWEELDGGTEGEGGRGGGEELE